MEIVAAAAADPGRGIIVHNDAQHFSAGVDLNAFRAMIEAKDFDGVDKFLDRFQKAVKALKYTNVPVIGAPSGLAIGGGFEVLAHCDKLIAHANSVMGLVESGVGVVPAGGGVKESYLRWFKATNDWRKAAWQTWMQIGYGLTGTSPELSAKFQYFLNDRDISVMNRDKLITMACDELEKMIAAGYSAPQEPQAMLAPFDLRAEMAEFMDKGIADGLFFAHDKTTAMAIATIVTADEDETELLISEDELYARERRAFITLAQTAPTLERITTMLDKENTCAQLSQLKRDSILGEKVKMSFRYHADKFDGFEKQTANYVPLTPLSFLPRTALMFGDRPSVIYGKRRYNWQQTYDRCRALASALTQHGIQKHDTVAVVAANTPELVECHFGVAMAGGVLNTINVRLDASTIAYILNHGEARFLITDTGFSAMNKQALAEIGRDDIIVIDIIDNEAAIEGETLGQMDYEAFIAGGDSQFEWHMPEDEWAPMSLNYTSGTSGLPKGVVYHHRGSYLMSMGTVTDWDLPRHPTYLYTVPMFHCNGWGHAWTMTALAGTIICVRAITAEAIYQLINEHKITHFGGAPIVLGMIVNADDSIDKICLIRCKL